MLSDECFYLGCMLTVKTGKRDVKLQGWETSGLILISELRSFILSMKFHFYICSQDHSFMSKVVILVNICLK